MNKLLLIISVFIIFIFSGCEDKKETKVEEVKKPLKYEGQSIVVIVPKLHAGLIRGPIMEEAKKFETLTGAKIRVVTPSWNDTIEKTQQSLVDPNLHYDIFVVIAMWNGMLLANDHIEPVPQWVKDKIQWDDVLPIYKNSVLSYNNIAYGMPYDGDCINLYYRKDIFSDQKIQEKYKQQFNKELTVPTTWEEYKQTAKFFTGWDWDNDGEINYGNSLLRKKEILLCFSSLQLLQHMQSIQMTQHISLIQKH